MDRRQMRLKSMLGTVLFAIGIIGAVIFALNGSLLIGLVALVCLVPGLIMLFQVGKSLP